MSEEEAAGEDWELLKSFLPSNWRFLARRTDAIKGLRQDKSEEKCLRTLLIHLACGYSLRETVVRAREAHLAELSDVALLKRLRKSEEWLYELCRSLFEEANLATDTPALGRRIRLVDATHVKEPGKTGSVWRIHYSLSWPSLRCDYFKLSASRGEGNGESLSHLPVKAGDCLLADRGYSTAQGIHDITSQKAELILRLNPQGIRVLSQRGELFPFVERLQSITRPGQVEQWNALVPLANRAPVRGRVCVVRKSEQATQLALKKLRRKVAKNNLALEPQTLLYASYVLVFTTLPEAEFSAHTILEWYRLRWQIELVFKRFKQIARLGHLPKSDPASARAWLYGKLLVALLAEKLIAHAKTISPWGYHLQSTPTLQPLA
jgi:Transposase DDE domain